METIMILATSLAPIITGLVELIKRYLPAHHKEKVPFLAVILGVVISYVLFKLNLDLTSSITLNNMLVAGVIAGLSSAGLYDLLPTKPKDYPSYPNDDYGNGAGTPEQ